MQNTPPGDSGGGLVGASAAVSTDQLALYSILLSIDAALETPALLQSFVGATAQVLQRAACIADKHGNILASAAAGTTGEALCKRCRATAGSCAAGVALHPADAVYPISDLGELRLCGDGPVPSSALSQGLREALSRLASAWHSDAARSASAETVAVLQLATEVDQLGIWQFDPQSQQFRLNRYMLVLLDRTDSEPTLDYNSFLKLILPEDRKRFAATVHNFIEHNGGERLEFQFRVRLPAGDILKLECFGRMRQVPGSETAVLVGVCRDITWAELDKTETLYRSELESLIMSLSLNMINAPVEQIDEAMTEALEKVSRFVGADRAYRFDYDWVAQVCHNTHEWCAEGITPQIHELQNISVSDLVLWTSSHRKGLPFLVSSVSSLPAGHPLREILEPQDIKSLITLPMMDQNECVGFIGFDAVRAQHTWTEVETSLLTLVAQLMVNAEERRRHEEDLRQTLRELELSRDSALTLADIAQNANESKSRFVANMSHEIRTPLHIILGMSEYLEQTSLSADQQRSVRALRNAGSSLSALIEDILDFSRLESKKIVIARKPFAPAEVLLSTVDAFRPMAEKKGITLRYTPQGELPSVAVGDALRIRQILNNLIGNAIKFTDHGEVELRVEWAHAAEVTGVSTLCMAVRDTGIGMSRQQQEKIFQPFYQADNPNRQQGTGLGLTIVKSLVKLMHGNLQLESELTRGSVFRVDLPLERAEQPAEAEHWDKAAAGGQLVTPDTAWQALRDKRVLVVEDSAMNQLLLKAHLRDIDCELLMADDGREAVNACARNRFDLILMDCRMPVMDGLQATRAIRAGNSPSADTPIIALTANNMPGDRESCFSAGMNDFLPKPFTRQQLLDVMCKHLPAEQPQTNGERAH